MPDPVVHIQNIQPAARIAIRNRIKSILIPNTDLGGRWFCSRPKAIFVNELPCGLIYFTTEDADHQNIVPRSYKRTLTLITEVVHRLESERDNALDDFLDSRSYEIESTILQDRYIGLQGLVEDTVLISTEAFNIDMGGDEDIASVRIFWNITYRTDAFYQGTLDEFLKYIADFNTKDGAIAQDQVTIREA